FDVEVEAKAQGGRRPVRYEAAVEHRRAHHRPAVRLVGLELIVGQIGAGSPEQAHTERRKCNARGRCTRHEATLSTSRHGLAPVSTLVANARTFGSGSCLASFSATRRAVAGSTWRRADSAAWRTSA